MATLLNEQHKETHKSTLSLRNYARDKAFEIERIAKSFMSLSEDDKEWLGDWRRIPSEIAAAVSFNQIALNSLANRISAPTNDLPNNHSTNVDSLMMELVREWSSEGQEERTIYKKMLDYINIQQARVLIPGVGLGRLAYECALMGHNTSMIDSDPLKYLIMKDILSGKRLELQPYALETCNRRKSNDHLRRVLIPDITISSEVVNRLNGKCENMFEFQPRFPFDFAMTSYFIDCSGKQVLNVARSIFSFLKPGGLWINCGGLTYKNDKIYEMPAIEIIEMLSKIGFIVEQSDRIATTYCENSRSLMRSTQRAVFFTARKPR